jgi:hypothetical protein
MKTKDLQWYDLDANWTPKRQAQLVWTPNGLHVGGGLCPITRRRFGLLIIQQDLTKLRVVVRPDPSEQKIDLMAQHIGHVVTQTELRRLEMRDENRLRLIQTQHTVHVENSGPLRQKHQLRELHPSDPVDE